MEEKNWFCCEGHVDLDLRECYICHDSWCYDCSDEKLNMVYVGENKGYTGYSSYGAGPNKDYIECCNYCLEHRKEEIEEIKIY